MTEAVECGYRFAAQVYPLNEAEPGRGAAGRSAQPAGRFSLALELDPLVQAAQLASMRTGRATTFAPDRVQVSPIWESARGRPFVDGLAVNLVDGTRMEFPRSALLRAVQAGSAELVRTGRLRPGDRFSFDVAAFPVPAATLSAPRFALTPEPEPWDLPRSALEGFVSRSTRQRTGHWCDSDIVVIVHRAVVDDVRALARTGGEEEAGGMLVGHLRRDTSHGDLFLEVTAVLPTPFTEATRASLAFRPESFAAVERLIELRRLNERIVGWVHSHPWFCRGCPPARRAVCAFGKPFFSEADENVHHALFPRAYSVALLVSDLGQDELAVDMYGWRRGEIAGRGFNLFCPAGATDERT